MESKFIEVRDRLTRIDVLATKLVANDPLEFDYLKHNGLIANDQVSLMRFDNTESSIDPYSWGILPRTMYEAHEYIRKNFDNIPSYWTLDIETILNEKKTMKLPERYNHVPKIAFLMKSELELSNANIVRNILREEYKLKVDRMEVIESNIVKFIIDPESIYGIGIRFYEVLNDYLVCI